MPKKSRGRAPDKDYRTLQINQTYLLDQLKAGDISNHLFSAEILDEDDIEAIQAAEAKGRRSGVEKLLEILRHSGTEAFPSLVDICKKDDVALKHVATKLETTWNSL